MIVKVATQAGFCNGVRNAVDTALELAQKYGRIYTLGELVHNELVTDYLAEKGVVCLDIGDVKKLKKGDVALIRAHGIPIQLENELKEKGVLLFDATCPVVKRNQNLARERSDAGDSVIIVGDKNHDEVIGVASYAGKDVAVFSDGENLKIGDKNTSVLFQTTILAEKFAQIEEFIKNFQKKHNNLVGIFNTICYTTKHRQDETRVLAESSDAVIVLGSHTSANTKRLYEVAKQVNPDTYFATCADEVRSMQNFFKDNQCVSIVAGASTPPWLIREVTKLMSETQKNAVETVENEVQNEATLQEQATVESKEPTTMADLMESAKAVGYINYKVGKRIKGKVISAGENGIYVAIGGKKDGFIDKSEASLDGNYNPADFKEGDEIQATIVAVNKEYVSLSKKEVDAIRQEEAEAEKALAAGEFSLTMTEVVKGGLRGKLGQYTIFVPASQIRMGYVSNLEDYKGKTLRLVIMPPKTKENPDAEGEGAAVEEKPAKKSRYLFASQRMILEREKQEKEDLFWNNIHVHDIVTGKVKRFTQFGAFVNVRGFDCLAHISELSWNKVTDPASVLTIGESYDFVVLKMDRETGKISLGYKQLQKKPYELAAEKFPVGTVIKGKVERIFPYGAFVSIDDGVDGLVHVSQISHNWIKDANEALTVGQEVEAKIIGFDDNRITLSIKELLPTPEETTPVEVAEADGSEDEKAAKRTSRVKKFEQKVAEGENKRERRNAKKETSNEPKEWVSGTSTATLGDLFKNLNLNLADETVEEPKKKSTRKKKVEDAE